MTWMSWPVLSKGLHLDLASKVSVCRACTQAAAQGTFLFHIDLVLEAAKQSFQCPSLASAPCWPLAKTSASFTSPSAAARPDWQDCLCLSSQPGHFPPPAVPAGDVLLPAFLEEQESARLINLFYVTDFLTQFGRVLGIQALTLVQLQQLLGLQSIKAALELQRPHQGSPSPVPADGKQGSEAPPEGRAGSRSPALPGPAAGQLDQALGSRPVPQGERQAPQAHQQAAMESEAAAEPTGVAAGHRSRRLMPELENGESSSGRNTGSTKTELLDSECTDVLHVKIESSQRAKAGLPRQHINGFAQHGSGLAKHAVRAAVGVQEGNGLLYEDGSRASIKQEPGQAGKLMSGLGEGRPAPVAEGGQSPVMLDLPADAGRTVPVQQRLTSAAEPGQSADQQMHPPAVDGRQSPVQQLHLPTAVRKQSPVQQLHEPAAEGRQSPQKQLQLPAAEGRLTPEKQHSVFADDSLRQQPPSAEVCPAVDEEGACPQPQWLWEVYQGLLSHLLPVSCGDCMLCLCRRAFILRPWSRTPTGSRCTLLPESACSSVRARCQ